MSIIADLHIHSKYSRAVSPKMDLYGIARSASIKGIDLVATGDWTHPLWFHEINENLKETYTDSGLYCLKKTPIDIINEQLIDLEDTLKTTVNEIADILIRLQKLEIQKECLEAFKIKYNELIDEIKSLK